MFPLEIEAAAKRRLADEYDAAQERGEVGQSGARTDLVPKGNEVAPSASDVGLTRKDIHEARQFRDAETNDPGVTKRTLTELLDAGHEPAKAVRRSSAQPAVQARQARALRPPARASPEAAARPPAGHHRAEEAPSGPSTDQRPGAGRAPGFRAYLEF